MSSYHILSSIRCRSL